MNLATPLTPRSVLLHTSTPLATLVAFVAPLTLAAPSINLKSEDPIVSETAELPAYLAIEFLADALVEEAARLGVEGTEKRDEAAAVSTAPREDHVLTLAAVHVARAARPDPHQVLAVPRGRVRCPWGQTYFRLALSQSVAYLCWVNARAAGSVPRRAAPRAASTGCLIRTTLDLPLAISRFAVSQLFLSPLTWSVLSLLNCSLRCLLAAVCRAGPGDCASP